MPRRRRLPSANNKSLVVQKTHPLLTLSETSLTLCEFKILDAYLARINSHDPEHRCITLERGTLEKYLGVTEIRREDLEKRVDNLFQTVTIRDPNKPKGFTKIALFEKAECIQDDDGLWQVHLVASPSAMEYIFTPENIGYLRYCLSDVVSLTSRYSYVLYLYLECNRYRKSWEIPLDELKAMLRCTAETYSKYYRFNELVLSRCHKELNEKTKCHFFYDPIKRGRSVVAVRFTLDIGANLDSPGLGAKLKAPEQYEVENWQDDSPNVALIEARMARDEICDGFSSAVFDEFSNEQLELLRDLAYMVDNDTIQLITQKHNDQLHDLISAKEFAVSEYLSWKIKSAKMRRPKNLFAYVKKSIENEMQNN